MSRLPFPLSRAGIVVLLGLSVYSQFLRVVQAAEPNEVTLVPAGSCWRYWDRGGDPGADWRERGYFENAWPAGDAQFGYGDGDEATLVGFGLDPQNRHITTWFRHSFNMLNPRDYTNLVLRLRRDDGVVVYLNGVEIFRDNLPAGPIAASTLATLAADDGNVVQMHSLDPGSLLEEENVLAAEVHQASADSDDLSFDLELSGRVGLRTPTLSAAIPGPGFVQLSWLGPSRPDFVLQSRAALSAANEWVPVSEVLSFEAGRWSVTLSQGPGSRFFRLCAAEGAPALCPAPVITNQTLSADAPIGTDVTLSVGAAGGPGVTYNWRRNQVFLLSETGPSLTLTNAQRGDGGLYDVVVGNECGCTPSCPIPVRIGGEEFPLADNFVARLQTNSMSGNINAGNADATREAGEPANPVRVYGRTVWLEWLAPAAGIVQFDTHGSGQDTTLAVYTNSVLSSLALQASAGPVGRPRTSEVVVNVGAGQLLQIAADGNGFSPLLALNWKLTSTSGCGPQIIVPPLSMVVPEGSNALFSVVATTCDPNPLVYQWFRSAIAMVGETNSSLLLTNVQFSDAAQYRVQVSNPQGAVGSGPASLIVLVSGNITAPWEDFIYGSVCGSKFTNSLMLCFRTSSTSPTVTSCPLGYYPFLFPDPSQQQPGSFANLEISTVHAANYGMDTALKLSTHNGGSVCKAPSCNDTALAIACSKLSTTSISYGTCIGTESRVLVGVHTKAVNSYVTTGKGTCPQTAFGPVTILHRYY